MVPRCEIHPRKMYNILRAFRAQNCENCDQENGYVLSPFSILTAASCVCVNVCVRGACVSLFFQSIAMRMCERWHRDLVGVHTEDTLRNCKTIRFLGIHFECESDTGRSSHPPLLSSSSSSSFHIEFVIMAK